MTASPKKSDKSSTDTPIDAVRVDDVQAWFDEANAQGYFGHTPDSTPNENYTLAGVTSGAPTPENQRGQ